MSGDNDYIVNVISENLRITELKSDAPPTLIEEQPTTIEEILFENKYQTMLLEMGGMI